MPPHNESNNVNCGSCHGQGILESPFWGGTMSYDQLCLNCHTASSGPYTETNAPLVKTHSSENTSENYGVWSWECKNCHDPHYQKQKNYKSTDWNNLYLAYGTITSYEYYDPDDYEVTYFDPDLRDTSVIVYSSIIYKTQTGWDAAKLSGKTEVCRRTILFPNVKKLGYSYPIIAVDEGANTIKVKGDIGPVYKYISPPTDFIVLYGQYIRDNIDGNQVKFFDQTGTNSFADGDTTINGICEVCHTLTSHWRNDGTLAGTGVHSELGGGKCTVCHNHTDGFDPFNHLAEGAVAPAAACIVCHETVDPVSDVHGNNCGLCHADSNGAYRLHGDVVE